MPESEVTMPDTKDVKMLLTEAIRKRDELNTFIKVLQEMAGAEAPATESAAAVNDSGQPTPGQEVSDPLSVVYAGLFWGKSQTAAAKILLERVRRPLKTKVIFECLKKGGLEVGGKKPEVNLWGILNRANDTFVLVPKAGWDLIERYDPAVIAKMRKEDSAKENGEEEDKSAEGTPAKPNTAKAPVWKPKD
jgi:hypothetical protein